MIYNNFSYSFFAFVDILFCPRKLLARLTHPV